MSTASLSTTTTISSAYTNGDLMAKIFTLVKKAAKKPIPFVKKGVETLTMPLECLKTASGLIPVPALGPATDIVLSILKKVDQSQQNTATAREIANLCLKAHVTLSEHLQSVEITPTLLDSIRQFEADLHNIENTVEEYEQKMSIDQTLYSKIYSDELQRVEKQVNSTLLLFQIKKLLSLEETCAKMSTSLQHIVELLLMNHSEAAPKPEEPLVDIVRRSHLTLCEEIAHGPGYSIQRAEMRGKIVTIKVFTGCKAKPTWEASNMLDLKIMHPNVAHLIGASRSDELGAPFSVYDLDIKHRFEDVVSSWSAFDFDTLSSLFDKMDHDVISARNHLCEQTCLFAQSGEVDCDILCDARGRFVISLRPEVASSSTALVSPADYPKFKLVMSDTRHNDVVGTPVCLAQVLRVNRPIFVYA
ncbi:uncharacterized protein EV420DRAFT_1642836 [Desarmillaria tabescens]|uniref:Protein kinase domain-containing protein n=1 Tax=Armillaria tabescens TaxID=1929756 RepID=A0AA39N5S3_ARMTA|nr:uncharacterized protein EV420DRAFT_1642836 [Desarmillaria tabescens]KAK0458493.1 hypothetical protein EV420DRAFT_1642836 [Desarmillaria tabescens]